MRQENLVRLEAIATLKLSQINSWRSERLQDAWTFFENTIVSRAVVDFIRAPDRSDARVALEPLLEATTRRVQYRSVSIFSRQGTLLLSFPAAAHTLPPRARSIVVEMAAGRAPGLSDPFLNSDGLVRLLLVSPVLDPSTGVPIGAVAIEVDPQDSL